jgi:hypothetical protein
MRSYILSLLSIPLILTGCGENTAATRKDVQESTEKLETKVKGEFQRDRDEIPQYPTYTVKEYETDFADMKTVESNLSWKGFKFLYDEKTEVATWDLAHYEIKDKLSSLKTHSYKFDQKNLDQLIQAQALTQQFIKKYGWGFQFSEVVGEEGSLIGVDPKVYRLNKKVLAQKKAMATLYSNTLQDAVANNSWY